MFVMRTSLLFSNKHKNRKVDKERMSASKAAATKAASMLGSKKKSTTLPPVRMSLLVRLKAWWLGVENVEAYAKYGERSAWRAFWTDFGGTVVTTGCIVLVFVNRNTNNIGDQALKNAEMNRKMFYGMDFEPENVKAPGEYAATHSIYGGPQAMMYRDEETKLGVNQDNRVVAPSRDELQRLFHPDDKSKLPSVTPDMIAKIQKLKETNLY